MTLVACGYTTVRITNQDKDSSPRWRYNFSRRHTPCRGRTGHDKTLYSTVLDTRGSRKHTLTVQPLNRRGIIARSDYIRHCVVTMPGTVYTHGQKNITNRNSPPSPHPYTPKIRSRNPSSCSSHSLTFSPPSPNRRKRCACCVDQRRAYARTLGAWPLVARPRTDESRHNPDPASSTSVVNVVNTRNARYYVRYRHADDIVGAAKHTRREKNTNPTHRRTVRGEDTINHVALLLQSLNVLLYLDILAWGAHLPLVENMLRCSRYSTTATHIQVVGGSLY